MATIESLTKRYRHLYDTHHTMKGHRCYYCGEPTIEREFVPPPDQLQRLTPVWFKGRNIPIVVIRCCDRCKDVLSLSTEPLNTLDERIRFVEANKHYGPIIRRPVAVAPRKSERSLEDEYAALILKHHGTLDVLKPGTKG